MNLSGRRTRWVMICATLFLVLGVTVTVLAGSGRRVSDQDGAAAPSSPRTTQSSTRPSTQPTIPTGTASAAARAATRVVTLAGMTAAGEPAAGFTVEDIDATVDTCVPSPAAAGHDIVACVPSAAGADICWIRSDRIHLLCGGLPWDKHLYRLAADVPVSPSPAAKDPAPWGLELSNGMRCRLRNGGAWGGRSDGYVGAYSCTPSYGPADEIFVLTNSRDSLVNRSSPSWTVLVGNLGGADEQFPPPTAVAVTVAFLAGPAT